MEELSKSELNIMIKILEENRPLYFEEIIDLVSEYKWVESTVRNFLARIIEKGYLKTEKDGKKNIYIPLVSKDYLNKKGKSILEKLFNNSLKNFVAELYESDSIEYDDILELKEYLDNKIKKRR